QQGPCAPPTDRLCSPTWWTEGCRGPTPEGSRPGFPAGPTPLSGLLQVGVRFLPHPVPAAPAARLAACCPAGSPPAGGRRVDPVPRLDRSGFGRASRPVARRQRRGNAEPPDLATCLVARAYQHP